MFQKIWYILKKIQNSNDIDETLKFVTNNFINSKSYKLVSNYWHILNIKNYEVLLKSGVNKYGSTIAKNYYTFTELHHDEWFEQLVNNLKNNHLILIVLKYSKT